MVRPASAPSCSYTLGRWPLLQPRPLPDGSALPAQCFLGPDPCHPPPHTPGPRLPWALHRLLTRLGPRPPGVHSEGTASALPSGQVQGSDLCFLLLPMRPPPFSSSPPSWRSPPPPHLACPNHCSTHTRPPGGLPSCSFSISLQYSRPLHPFWLHDALSRGMEASQTAPAQG